LFGLESPEQIAQSWPNLASLMAARSAHGANPSTFSTVRESLTPAEGERRAGLSDGAPTGPWLSRQPYKTPGASGEYDEPDVDDDGQLAHAARALGAYARAGAVRPS
jgi:hypothetical protein